MTARTWVVGCVALALLGGCASGPSGDPAVLAARDAHAAVAGVTIAAELQLDRRATTPFSQVVIEEGLTAAADAQRELTTAEGVDPARRDRAAAAIDPAVATLRSVADTGAAGLTPGY